MESANRRVGVGWVVGEGWVAWGEVGVGLPWVWGLRGA